ncbi:MAG: Bax inhibitor-1/YccA family protein [Lachnospiraceae bacterium]|nr:Bax inhibitor-1/YccA family protein [Lachnospiraceae bacterium]
MNQRNDDMYNQYYNGGGMDFGYAAPDAAVYQGVLTRAFLYMVVALGITAVAAFTTADLILIWMLRNPYSLYILFAVEIGIVIASNWALRRNNTVLSAVLFAAYSFINGATIGIILLAYTETSVGASFLMAGGMFAVMAVYGMVTKKDLSSWGSILLMGLIGIIIASLVNLIFLRNGMMDFVVSLAAIAIFVGLTAYDTQKLKKRAMMASGSSMEAIALMGAFELYLDFVNLFLRLLSIMGKRK